MPRDRWFVRDLVAHEQHDRDETGVFRHTPMLGPACEGLRKAIFPSRPSARRPARGAEIGLEGYLILHDSCTSSSHVFGILTSSITFTMSEDVGRAITGREREDHPCRSRDARRRDVSSLLDPAALSEELPDRDGAPMRVRLLGENLVAFRDTDGVVGLMEDACPHRLAPMFFGRNEECGLRCVYHGWKFDRNGTCVDMPSEPPDSLFKTKVTIETYPTWEGGGVVWTYMGRPRMQPPPPDYEWMRAPETHRFVSKTFEDVQLAAGARGRHRHLALVVRAQRTTSTTRTACAAATARRGIEVEKTDYGYRYVVDAQLGDDGEYVRVYHYVMPAQQLRGGVTVVDAAAGRRCRSSTDTSGCRSTTRRRGLQRAVELRRRRPDHRRVREDSKRFSAAAKTTCIPGLQAQAQPSQRLLDRPRAAEDADLHRDRRRQHAGHARCRKAWARSSTARKEHLGTSDRAIIAARQLLLEAIDDVEAGRKPRGVEPESYRTARPYDDYLPHGKDWRVAFAPELVAKVVTAPAS